MLRYSRLCLFWLLFASVSANDAVDNEKFNKREASLRRRLLDEAAAAAKATPATGGETARVEEVTTTTEAAVETPKQTAESKVPDGDNKVVAETPAEKTIESKKSEKAAATTPPTEEAPQKPADVEKPDGDLTKIDVTPPADGAGAGNEKTPPANEEGVPDSGSPPAEEAKNACADATNCKDCQTAGMLTQSTTQGFTCFWKIEEAAAPCKLVQQSDAPTGDMCETTNTPTARASDANDSSWDDDEGGGSGFTMVIGFLAVVLLGGAAYRFRKNAAGFGDGEDGKSTAVSDFGSILGSVTSRSAYSKSETVPLARSSPDDDEEWGWEDSSTGDNGGDVEMTAKNDDEDLTMAFSISQTRPSAPKASPAVRPKSSPVVSRPINSSMSSTPYSAAATSAMPTMQITSLGLKKASGVGLAKKKPMKKKQEDDLFASMGLAAKPTFSQAPKAKTAAKPNSSALAATDMGDEPDWDDDGDLDDLLND